MFSKIIVIASWAVAVTLTTLSCCGVTVDPVALAASWGEVTAVNAFYLWKAKNENRAKYAQKFLDDFAEKYGADTAVRMAEVVLKD